jgi:hypothetical protein
VRLHPGTWIPAGRRPARVAPSARGSVAGRSITLGVVALSAAAVVALAGCTVVPAPARGAASRPAASASGTARTAAKPAPSPSPSPKQRAVADADAIFAAFAVPPGARKLPSAPSVGGGALARPSQSPVSPDLLDKAGWWLAPGPPQQVLAWEAAHRPHRFSVAGTGSSSGPSRTVTIFNDIFSLPVIYGVLDWRALVVQAVADGRKTAIRVDAQVTWIPARPASEKIPAAAQVVTISQDLGGNQGSAEPPRPVTITDPVKVRQLVALIDGLPLTDPDEFSCPRGFGDSLTLTFRAGPGQPALAVATAELSGCPDVDFTIGGKPQPALAAVSGPLILKIAGLPWKIPVRSISR